MHPVELDTLSETDLRALLEADTAYEQKAYEAFPYLGFKPNAAQRKMLALIEDGLCDANGFRPINQQKRDFFCPWGNGTGKSYLWAPILMNMAVGVKGMAPVLKKYRWITNWPFPKRVRIFCNAKQLKEGGSVTATIMHWWPKSKYRSSKQGQDYDSLYELPNGWVVDVLSFDQSPETGEGVKLGMGITDEPPPKFIWDALPARFREGGLRWGFGTLCNAESSWIQQDILENKNVGWFYADLHKANCKQCAGHDENGNPMGTLDHDECDRMIASYSPEERESRESGKPIHLAGRAFRCDDEAHVVDDKFYPKDGTAYLALDPHPTKPWAVMVAKMDQYGFPCIVEEWPTIMTPPWHDFYHKVRQDTRGIAEYVQVIKDLATKHNVSTMIIDGHAASQQFRSDSGATNLRDMLLNQFGLFFVDGDPHVEGETGGCSILKEFLRYNERAPLDFRNRPKLTIAKSCHNTIYQLSNITWLDNGKLDPKLLDFPRLLMYIVCRCSQFDAEASKREKMFANPTGWQTE